MTQIQPEFHMFNHIFIETICTMGKISQFIVKLHFLNKLHTGDIPAKGYVLVKLHVLKKCPNRIGNEEKLKGFYKRKSLIWNGVYWGERDLFNSIKCDLFIVFSRVIDFEWIFNFK